MLTSNLDNPAIADQQVAALERKRRGISIQKKHAKKHTHTHTHTHTNLEITVNTGW